MLDPKDPKDHKEPKDHTDLRDHQDLLDLSVPLEMKETKDVKDPQESILIASDFSNRVAHTLEHPTSIPHSLNSLLTLMIYSILLPSKSLPF